MRDFYYGYSPILASCCLRNESDKVSLPKDVQNLASFRKCDFLSQ